MGLLDADINSPEGQGLLSAAFSLLGAQNMPGQRGLGSALGDAGRQYMGASNQARDSQMRRLLAQSQIDENNTQAMQRKAAIEALQRKRDALPGLYGDGMSPAIGMPPVQAGQQAMQSPRIDYLRALQAGYTPDEIQKLAELPNAGRAEVARTVEVMENGRPVTKQLDKFGQPVGDGLGVYKAPVFQNLGGRTVAIDPVSMREAGSFAQSMSPSERDASARGWASNSLARERLNFDKNGGAEGGKPQLVDGQWVYKPTAENPQGRTVRADGFEPKLPESQQKQVVGVNNLSNAITEYREQLKSFGPLAALSPDARAGMGTKYNNMMLQAKEAYNLGVLNGPDFEILTSVITDPRSVRGAITSKDALDKQASELDRIMRGVAAVSGQAKQPKEGGASKTGKTIVKTGTYGGKKVVQYSDGSTDYAD